MRLIILHSSHPLFSFSSFTHTLLLNYIPHFFFFYTMYSAYSHIISPHHSFLFLSLLFSSSLCSDVRRSSATVSLALSTDSSSTTSQSRSVAHYLTCPVMYFLCLPFLYCPFVSLLFHLLFLPFPYCFTFPAPSFCPLPFPSSPVDTHLSLLLSAHLLLSPSLPSFPTSDIHRGRSCFY